MRLKTSVRTMKADKNPDHFTIDNGVTIEQGGLEVTSGGITVTAGGLTTTAGGLTVTAGDITATAGDVVATAGDLIATAGDITATAGDITATAGDLVATAGDLTLSAGDANVTGTVNVTEAAADAGAGLTIAHNQVIHTVAGGGITETLTAAIPANSLVLGVHGKIKTTVVADTGVSFLLGVTGDTNRFGNFAALTQNTAQDPSDHQAEAIGIGRFYAAATDVLLTLNAGTFTSGVVTVDIYYITLSPTTDY